MGVRPGLEAFTVFAGVAVLYNEVTDWTSSIKLKRMCPLMSTSSVAARKGLLRYLDKDINWSIFANQGEEEANCPPVGTG